MQQIRFEQEKMNNYMVVPCVVELDRNSYGEEILEQVKIPGLMNYEIREIDGEQTLYYRLKYRTSLKQVLGDLKMTFELVKNMLSSIVDVLKQTEEYLLDSDAIIWKSEYIFVEVSSGRLSFAYYPKVPSENNSLKNLLVELIQYVEKSNQKTYLYLMGFYNLVTNPDYTREQLEQYVAYDCEGNEKADEEEYKKMESIDENSEKKKEASIIKSVSKDINISDNSKKSRLATTILAAVNLVVVCLLLFDVWTYQYIWVLIVTLFLLFVAFLVTGSGREDENPDRIMEEYMNERRKEQGKEYRQQRRRGDVIMNSNHAALRENNQRIVVEDYYTGLCLKSMNPKEFDDLIIDTGSIVLGRMKSGCNYLLKQSRISRMHAKIVKKDDGVFLIDLNSTNGTYLNDEKITGGTEYLLKEGDVVSLANIVTFVVVVNNVVDK